MEEFDFKKEILDRSHALPVVVQFSSSGCGPCLFVEKQMIQITRKMEGKIEYVSLKAEDHPEELETYHIKSNPTLLLIIDGELKGRLKAALPDYAIEQWINDHLSQQTDFET